MLSRVALRAVAQAGKGHATASVAVVPQRNFNDHTRSLDERLKLFKEVTETYYTNPERDVKNFPVETLPDLPPTRMIIFPDSWWANLYPKMGTSGPYVLGLGGLLTLFGKEYILMDHHMSEAYAFAAGTFFLWYKLRDYIVKDTMTTIKETNEANWDAPKAVAKKQYADAIQHMETAIWQEDGQRYLYEAKREGIDLQLEAIYRQRVAEARSEIKKRLDYQLAKETAVKNFEHNYMTRWIIDNVVKGITPEQEKASIAQCLGDLKAIAARQ
ncbi:hypothetical protein CAPTEDRAFT_21700 [Capitella teleta]|uniref:ATP synthase subunit b n=2 Tax=Capitella teleta TaxID=283909 RepID=N1PB09_CAPTE|nr:hypothetical protein CAPTEDRAFT_21700 [Capitella teleta]|eukprot:ELU18843.1 hypothetical protein CAPTEDRAFT_21700 [Capitella teleta]